MNSVVRLDRGIPASFFVCLYGWSVTVLFGAVFLDVAYASAMRELVDSAQTELVFAEMSDLLLVILGFTVLAALAALGSAWQSPVARNLIGASVLVTASQIVAAAVLGSVLVEPGSGWWLRLLLSGSASVLALLGLKTFVGRA